MDQTIVRNCYERIIDEESKDIYSNRIMYNLTHDSRFMSDIIFKKDLYRELRDRLMYHRNNGQKLILFGAGSWIQGARALMDFYGGVVHCFADNDQTKKEWCGFPVISFDELKQRHKTDLIMITSWFGKDEIYNQLINGGFQEENIINLPYITDYYINRQYFDIPYLTHSDNEVFMDCGSADGNTTNMFIKWCQGNYDYVYAFEPNKIFVDELLRNNFRGIKGEIIEKGTWSRADKLRFIENGLGSRVVKHTESKEATEVEVTSIDEILNGRRATFIKMDVEGAEAESIIGAKETIRKYKPKMAICIYHKQEDPWVIPSLLLDYNPDYRFCVRHYFYDKRETVLYAI